MKHYVKALVNSVTGVIEHIAISDGLLTDEMVGQPDGGSHILQSFEFDTDDGSFIRARDALKEFTMKGNSAAERSDKAALIQNKSSKVKNLKKS